MTDETRHWLHAHFQSVSRAGNRHGLAALVIAAAGLAALEGPSVVLSVIACAGVVTLLALRGSQARLRLLLARLAERPGTDHADLEYVNAFPSTLALLRFVGSAGSSGTARLVGAAVSPVGILAPVAALLWFLFLWGYALGMHLPGRNPALLLDAVTLVLSLAAAALLSERGTPV